MNYIKRLAEHGVGDAAELMKSSPSSGVPQESRLDRKREKMKRYYESETEEQKLKRLEKAREYKRKQKVKLEKVETPEQRMERLRKQRERQRRFYARETEEQRNRRLNKV